MNSKYTRNGAELNLPKLQPHFGPAYLDGEIWYANHFLLSKCLSYSRFGRGLFLDSQKVINSDFEYINWPQFRYAIVDCYC